MPEQSTLVPVVLANGVRVHVEASRTGAPAGAARSGERDVAYAPPDSAERDVALVPADFDGVSRAIEGIANSLTQAIQRIAPKKTTIEFGLELQLDSGALTALIVKGSGKSNLKVTMEWS
jgi:hypothetical protein